MIVIVDASVAAKWFLPEEHSDHAALLLAPEYELVAPDLIRLEVGSALLKALRRNEITVADCIEALGALLPGAVRTVRSADHAEAAFEYARRFGGSVYDAIYVSVARDLGARIVTDDARLAAVAGKMGVDASMIAEGAPALPDSTA